MKQAILIFSLSLVVFVLPAVAQTGDGKDPAPTEQLSIEQLLEADAEHNLDVAWLYFRQKKAYKAVLMRTDETIAAHPGFSKMDEVLYLAGMSSYYLSVGKGKQKIDLDRLPEEDRERYAPERLREDALALLSKLVEDHPESKYKGKAEETIRDIKKQKD